MAIGKSARGGYSQMALDWLRSLELSEGISIQHAESEVNLEYVIPKDIILLTDIVKKPILFMSSMEIYGMATLLAFHLTSAHTHLDPK